VSIGEELVEFRPIGSVVIGGFGRVNVQGPKGSAKLIAEAANVDDDAPSYERKWVWVAYPAGDRHEGFPFNGDEATARLLRFVLAQ